MSKNKDEQKENNVKMSSNVLFKKIKEIQGLPDEIVLRFLEAKGSLSGKKNERK